MISEEFFIKWFHGPLGLEDYRYREVARTINAMKLEKPRFERNKVSDWVTALPYIKQYYFNENLYLSIAFYKEPAIKEPVFQYLFYDFDFESDPDLAVRKALEFTNSLRKRFNIDVVLIRSGFKGLHIVIPLRRLIDFETYNYIWNYLVQPYDYSLVLDRQVCEPRRLQRIPYTWNIKVVNGITYRRLSRIVDYNLKPIKAEDFDWSNYEPLDPKQIPIVRISFNIPEVKPIKIYKDTRNKLPLPENIEDLIKCEAVPPCIKAIVEAMIKVGDLDHYQRLILVWYLKWIGYSIDQVIDFFKQYAKDYNERITRYQVEYAYGLRGSRKDWLMPSCKWLRGHGICLNCGWDRNPVTYTYRRAQVNPGVREKFFNLVKER